MMRWKILLVEDEPNIRRFVRIALEREGMVAFEAASAREARHDAATRRPDLIVVDLGLPDGDGKELVRELRGWISSPILVLSAREREEEKVRALDAGADDYLVKPFGVPELVARIRALLRRTQNIAGAEVASRYVTFGDVSVDLATHDVTRGGQKVHLTPIQYRLLAALIRSHGRVITYKQLLHDIWGAAYEDRSHYPRVYMMQLRQKLEEDFSQPKYLKTELQVGYRLTGVTIGRPVDDGASPPAAAPEHAGN